MPRRKSGIGRMTAPSPLATSWGRFTPGEIPGLTRISPGTSACRGLLLGSPQHKATEVTTSGLSWLNNRPTLRRRVSLQDWSVTSTTETLGETLGDPGSDQEAHKAHILLRVKLVGWQVTLLEAVVLKEKVGGLVLSDLWHAAYNLKYYRLIYYGWSVCTKVIHSLLSPG